MVDTWEKIWDWLKSIWLIGSNLTKLLEKQDEIKKKLDEVEQAIKSPQYQVVELEKIQKNADLLKDYYELEIKKLKSGSQQEIDRHKVQIENLTSMITELNEYKGLVVDAIGIIKQKNLEIELLNEELEKLKQKTPKFLGQTLLTSGFEYPHSSNFSPLAQFLKRKNKE